MKTIEISLHRQVSSFFLQNKRYLAYLVLCLLLLIYLKKYFLIIIYLASCIITMQYKRFMSIVLGIDFCLSFVLLASSSFSPLSAAFIGGASFFLGMLLSFEFTKSPIMTFYGTVFYALLAIIYSFIPSNMVFSFPILHLIIIESLFFIGASLIGAPISFLFKYVSTNIIANLLFIQIFGGLLKLIF